MEKLTALFASEGHILTDGNTYGSVIYLAEDRKEEEFHEITLEEYENILKAEEEPEIDPDGATVEDYKDALKKLGVE